MLKTTLLLSAALVAAQVHPELKQQHPPHQVVFPSYKSFPQETAQIRVLRGDPDDPELSKGLWFLSPFVHDFRPKAFGPQIVDNHGQLIWNGNSSVERRGHSGHVCYFRSAELNTLCFNDASNQGQGGHSMGTVKFLSNNYTLVGDYGATNGLVGPDNHELETPANTQGRTFIQQIFQPTPADLSGYGGPTDGYVLAGCFQERNSFTGAVEFQWCSYPVIDLEKTYVYMINQTTNLTNSIGGRGTRGRAWDYAHLNAISRTDDGDYVISCRHMNAIFLIAGQNSTTGQEAGSVVWQLGGKEPTIQSDGFIFSKQHAVRWRETKGNKTLITLFDNATDGVPLTNTSTVSSGMEISVDTETKVATLVRKYDHPDGRISPAQGMMQWLENGNVAIGWGMIGYYSEFTREGKLLLHAQYGAFVLQTYRIWKFPWKATPYYPPSMVMYARTCGAQMIGYASWNGATEVDSFRFYTSNHETGPWEVGPTERKSRFEVRTVLGNFTQYGYVEALDSEEKVIGTSEVTRVFVPAESIAENCTVRECDKLTNYSDPALSIASTCDFSSNIVSQPITLPPHSDADETETIEHDIVGGNTNASPDADVPALPPPAPPPAPVPAAPAQAVPQPPAPQPPAPILPANNPPPNAVPLPDPADVNAPPVTIQTMPDRKPNNPWPGMSAQPQRTYGLWSWGLEGAKSVLLILSLLVIVFYTIKIFAL